MSLSRLVDRLFLFSVVGELEKTSPINSGQFHLVKIPFLFRMSKNWGKFPVFNYSFYRHYYGPFSDGIYQDRDVLEFSRLIERKGKRERLTPKGKKIFEKLLEAKTFHRDPARKIQTLSKRMSRKGFGELKRHVYDLRVAPEQWKDGREDSIKALPMGTTIFRRRENIKDNLFFECLDKELLLDFQMLLVYSQEEYEEMYNPSTLPSYVFKNRLQKRVVDR